jgi:hypothetical protein
MQNIFIRIRVTATCIGPASTAVVFFQRPPLQQHLSLVIENENTESPVQESLLMSFHFFHGAQGLIFFIDQQNM